ncbi:hypothetical protein [Ferribacterium limneticum]|uniref:hypothetical protein n=1 Tax=Ferribacterium limneticum TaxID=76259 RepID=UPI001CFA736A|nr:hypothetical protein [Ferribacterium limneticum]UCV28137.1 hypothetical protein KI617_18140 [Ferribacterium limneticum]UCV32054.1 hypothetical protein KI608_18140 [Ferribacterium limneticum]
MTRLLGLHKASDWTWVVRRPPAAQILEYLVNKWLDYETKYSGIGEPFASRNEPALTEGLAAYLDAEYQAGAQPFDGEFFAELNHYDLLPDGKRSIIGRSDIEWRLSGAPNFIIEFKVIGGGRPAKAYITDGMIRFVDGRYAPKAAEGAMWAFFRPNSTETVTDIEAIIDEHVAHLRCQPENGMHRISPSVLAPNIASFDSVHERVHPAISIRLAHIFVSISDKSMLLPNPIK